MGKQKQVESLSFVTQVIVFFTLCDTLIAKSIAKKYSTFESSIAIELFLSSIFLLLLMAIGNLENDILSSQL